VWTMVKINHFNFDVIDEVKKVIKIANKLHPKIKRGRWTMFITYWDDTKSGEKRNFEIELFSRDVKAGRTYVIRKNGDLFYSRILSVGELLIKETQHG